MDSNAVSYALAVRVFCLSPGSPRLSGVAGWLLSELHARGQLQFGVDVVEVAA
jgi:hypothetical protein